MKKQGILRKDIVNQYIVQCDCGISIFTHETNKVNAIKYLINKDWLFKEDWKCPLCAKGLKCSLCNEINKKLYKFQKESKLVLCDNCMKLVQKDIENKKKEDNKL